MCVSTSTNVGPPPHEVIIVIIIITIMWSSDYYLFIYTMFFFCSYLLLFCPSFMLFDFLGHNFTIKLSPVTSAMVLFIYFISFPPQ